MDLSLVNGTVGLAGLAGDHQSFLGAAVPNTFYVNKFLYYGEYFAFLCLFTLVIIINRATLIPLSWKSTTARGES